MDWIRACKEDAKNRVKTASDFSEAGPFNEMVVMGVLAVRLQGLNRELLWDGDNMRFKNIGSGEPDRHHDRGRFHDPQRPPHFQQALHGSDQRSAVRRRR